MSTYKDNKDLRRIAHHLPVVVTVAEKGLSQALIDETSRALLDHELIKVKVNLNDRDTRRELSQALASACDAQLVQTIGKIIVLHKANPNPNPKLSNLVRFGT